MNNNKTEKNIPQEDDILKRAREKAEKKAKAKADKAALAQKKLDCYGIYKCTKSEDELKKAQKLKTLFMYLSTLLFAVYLFIPVEANKRLAEIYPAYSVYMILMMIGIVTTIYVSLHGLNRQRLKPEVSEMVAPRGGFDRKTFFSYEAFNAYHVVIALLQIGLTFWTFGIFGLLAAFTLTASAVFAFISRMILFKAYSGNMVFTAAKTPIRALTHEEAKAEDSEKKTEEAKTEDSEKKTEEAKAEDSEKNEEEPTLSDSEKKTEKDEKDNG